VKSGGSRAAVWFNYGKKEEEEKKVKILRDRSDLFEHVLHT
jgi:hypothetical protein